MRSSFSISDIYIVQTYWLKSPHTTTNPQMPHNNTEIPKPSTQRTEPNPNPNSETTTYLSQSDCVSLSVWPQLHAVFGVNIQPCFDVPFSYGRNANTLGLGMEEYLDLSYVFYIECCKQALSCNTFHVFKSKSNPEEDICVE